MGAFQAQGSSVRHGLNLSPMWAGDPHWHAVTVLRLKELQVEDDGAARVAKTHGPAIPKSPSAFFLCADRWHVSVYVDTRNRCRAGFEWALPKMTTTTLVLGPGLAGVMHSVEELRVRFHVDSRVDH